MKGTKPVIALAAASLLAACSSTQEIFRPFDVDQTSVSADAKQRVIISAERGTEGRARRIVCAEPSPDAASAIAASLGANLSASVPIPAGGQTLTPEAQLAFQRAIAEQVAYIGVRNSTIQLLRDGLYRACEAYMNGAIGDFGYSLILANYGRLMVALLTAEGTLRPAFTGPTILTTTASAAGGSANPQNPQPPSASGQGGGTPGSPQGDGTRPSDATLVRVIEMIEDLADPHRNPQKSVVDITVACFMWVEETPMRAPKNLSPAIQRFCDNVFAAMPNHMDAIMDASIVRARAQPSPGARVPAPQR